MFGLRVFCRLLCSVGSNSLEELVPRWYDRQRHALELSDGKRIAYDVGTSLEFRAGT